MNVVDATIIWPRDESVIGLVFVGIDGVLHSGSTSLGTPIEPCLPLLESVLRDFLEVRIVLTGSRCHHESLKPLRKLFSADIADRVVATLPGSGRRRRQRRIDAYLELHPLAAGTSWLAIDRWPEHVGDYFVWCIDGFQEGEAALLRVYLGGQ
jgi:hypothetical protein